MTLQKRFFNKPKQLVLVSNLALIARQNKLFWLKAANWLAKKTKLSAVAFCFVLTYSYLCQQSGQ
jgi:hypothetical protein